MTQVKSKLSKWLSTFLSALMVFTMIPGGVFKASADTSYTWQNVGSPKFSGGTAYITSLYVCNGIPYVAYKDVNNGNKVTVMKNDGSGWTTVGNAGFSNEVGLYISLYVYNGIPYVAYQDKGNLCKVTVMKYGDTGWATVGKAGFSGKDGFSGMPYANYISLYVYNGTPYVSYRDTSNDKKVTVTKYDENSNNWSTVGSAGFSTDEVGYTSLYVYNGIPYVAYENIINKVGKTTVMEYDGKGDTGWNTVGKADSSTYSEYFQSLYVYNGIPYVAYEDSNGATVMKYDDSSNSWSAVGKAGFSVGAVKSTSLYVYNGIPYVAYQDDGNSQKATVMKYDGNNWSVVGEAAFSANAVNTTSLYVYNGIPYVAYQDGGNSGGATVMAYLPDVPEFTLSQTSVMAGGTLTATSSDFGTIYVVPSNGSYAAEENLKNAAVASANNVANAAANITIPADKAPGDYWVYAVNSSSGKLSAFTELTVTTTVKVTFDKDGGNTDANPKAETVVYNGTVTLPTTKPTKLGYTFAGWNTGIDGKGTAFDGSTKVTDNITVYAQWTINSYIVTYDANGGSGTVPTQSNEAANATFTAAANSLTAPSGKQFKEWNTKDDGSGTAYAAGAAVTMPAGDVTLFAVWENIPAPPTMPTAPTITGPTALMLAAGYSATSTDAYTITGTAPVKVTKTSGDAKITWDDSTKELDIAAGLAAGSYPVTLKASNGTSPDATLTFTLTVNAATTAPVVTGVTVSPQKATVAVGSTRVFSAAVQGSNNSPQDVTWKVDGNKSANTVISSSGILAVGSDEAATTLTVTATSTFDTGKSGTATVTVKSTPTPPTPPSGPTGGGPSGGAPVTPIAITEPQGTGLGTAFLSDTTQNLSVNNEYTFKITSKDGKVPTLIVGTSGMFDVTLVRQDGNDYYFKLTAVGAPGRSVGIYVDGGSRLLVATVGQNSNYAVCDTACPFNVESGKSYVFKITARKKPDFEAGTPGVFRLEFLYQNGNNNYYRITAIGKPGDSCGFYLNGAKKPVSVATIR